MNPLYQDELFSATATNPAASGAALTAPAPGIGIGPSQSQRPVDQRREAISQMGGLQKFLSALGEFGAGVTGRPSPLDAQIRARQDKRMIDLKESESFLADMKNMGDLTAEMQGEEKTRLIETIASKWEAIGSGYGDAVRAVGQRPDLATGLDQYMPYLTEPQRAWAQRDPKGFLKWTGTDNGIEAMNAAADQPHLRRAGLKRDGVIMGWQQLLPKEVAARLNEDGVLTDAEIMGVQEQLPEKYRFSEIEKETIKRSKGMFWEGTGVLHGEKAEGVLADVAKERAKKGEDIAIVKDAAEYADRETGVVQRRLDAGWPEDDQRISGENDPEWHRARAKRYRSQGRDDLADTALKLASEKETAGPFGKINPSDYTTESIKAFQDAGGKDFSLLKVDPRQTKESGASKVSQTASYKAGESVAKEIGPILTESRAEALAGLEQVDAALRIKKGIAAGGAIVGPTATIRLKAAQIASMLGIGGKSTKEMIENTRQTIRGLAEFTISVRKKLKGQGQITEYEQKTLQKAYSGEIEDMTVEEIRTVASLTERLGRLQYKNHQNQLKNMANDDDPNIRKLVPYYSVPDMPEEQKGTELPGGWKIERKK